jgi:Mrp family chromosome partitioning ATPase
MSLLRLPTQHSPGASVAARPSGEDAEQGGTPPEQARPTRHPVPPAVLESCAGALAGIGGPTARSIAVTSCHRGEGRSTVALALALLVRTTYHRTTLLVELDFGHPCLASALGLPEGPGAAEVLRDETTVESALRWTDDDVAVLCAGDPGDAPAALLAQVAAGDLLDGLGGLFDTLVVDLPPLAGTGSSALVARRCSTPLLVVRAGATERHDIEKAVAMFDVPPPILMNGVSPRHAKGARRRSR